MTRYLVLAGLFVLSLITYIDRAAISSAKQSIGAGLRLDDQAMGAVFSAFALGYAIAQIPAGWFADRAGPRLMLTCVVTLWSVFTALTGAATGLWSLLAIRFAFGITEAGAFPGAARALYSWLPGAERGRAHGILFSGSRIGAACAFPLMNRLLASTSWRTVFALLSIPGLVWAALWAALFRNEPSAPPDRATALREGAGPGIPGQALAIIRTRPVRLAMTQYFIANFITFLPLSWMLPYLIEHYRLPAAQASYYATLPLLIGAAAQWISGFLVDALYRSGYRAASRRLPAMLGFALAAAGAAAMPFAQTAPVAVAFFGIATLGAELTISPSWTFCLDIAGKRSGEVTGTMNMAGNLGSFVSANGFPFLNRLTGGAGAYFGLVAALSAVAALCWTGMGSEGAPTDRREGRAT
jgi:ACS family glucarate transporter-like MFS transporter